MKTVSFDFDHTLSFNDNSLNEKSAEMFREHMRQNDTIFIVTSRHWSQGSEDAIADFLDTHGLLVEGIFHCGDWKDKTLKALSIDKHFDDDIEQLKRIEPLGIETVNCFDKEQFRLDFLRETGEEPLNLDEMF